MSSIIGIHLPNSEQFRDSDIEAIKTLQPGWGKVMSFTRPEELARVREVAPGCQFVVRLYDGSFGVGHHPNPGEFVDHVAPHIEALRPYCYRFQVHNEPNHPARYEGWGKEEADARDFNEWFCQAYYELNKRWPELLFGFPALAVPHNDLMWLDKCRPAIEMADWLGCHCYWQTPKPGDKNHLSEAWGLRFVKYHEFYESKNIYILEAGNSNCQATDGQKANGDPYPVDWELYAREFVEWFTELRRRDCVQNLVYPYIVGAMPFLLSSPDPNWDGFAWVGSDGRPNPVVDAVAALQRELTNV